METNKDILNQFSKRKKPIVPDGFFDQFYDDLMQKIQSENGILNQLKKTERPAVPEGFFDQLNDSLGSEMDTVDIESPILDQLGKAKKPEVEKSFFNAFPTVIIKKFNDRPDEGRIIPMRLFYLVGSIAAVLAILFLTVDFKENNSVAENPSIIAVDSLVEHVIFDDYLAVMDEQELIDYVIESNLSIEDTTTSINYDNYVDYTEEELLDYYLDL